MLFLTVLTRHIYIPTCTNTHKHRHTPHPHTPTPSPHTHTYTYSTNTTPRNTPPHMLCTVCLHTHTYTFTATHKYHFFCLKVLLPLGLFLGPWFSDERRRALEFSSKRPSERSKACGSWWDFPINKRLLIRPGRRLSGRPWGCFPGRSPGVGQEAGVWSRSSSPAPSGLPQALWVGELSLCAREGLGQKAQVGPQLVWKEKGLC